MPCSISAHRIIALPALLFLAFTPIASPLGHPHHATKDVAGTLLLRGVDARESVLEASARHKLASSSPQKHKFRFFCGTWNVNGKPHAVPVAFNQARVGLVTT